ncbi:MAG: hypothetical protein LQ337_001482 [Flavoplaca oasis]|nr:MAG: hypothetical protein LQ337_001482 [Flavoplaca oasis]
MKKLFHRKSKSTPSSPEQTPPRSRPAEDANGNPTFRTSRYESTSPAGMPQTGQYPLKGNNSAVALQGRPSETYSRPQASGAVEQSPRPSSSNPYYGSLPAPRVTSDSYNHQPSGNPVRNRPSEPDLAARSQRRQSAQYNIPPIEDFSKLSLDTAPGQTDYNDYPLRQQHNKRSPLQPHAQSPAYATTDHERLYDTGNASRFQHGGRGEPFGRENDLNRQPRNNAAPDQFEHDNYDGSFGRYGEESVYKSSGNLPEHAAAPTGSRSIPRKEVQPQQLPATNQTAYHSSPHTDYRSSARNPQFNGYPEAPREDAFQQRQHAPKVLESAAAISRLSANEVADRAKGNTYDTEVIEKVAPAVVHETVHDNVHHVREERITKEIHNHDIYHRILPIIDVEVLPPRHFLPVEGGGLVEISGKEVPGRGNNWVVAETASKIPSDQPAPHSLRPFTARQFVGTEGDAVRYRVPEGHERTEQTWVHPPELETGGRDTGQTWPMEFGNETPAKSSRSRSSKTKHSRKPVGPHASTTQQIRTQ